jgi:hypothetical protein
MCWSFIFIALACAEIDQPNADDVCIDVGCMDHTEIGPSYARLTIASG